MDKKALTLTILAYMTSNYGEGLGNVSSVQKVYKNGEIYSTRSRESLKNAIMVQSGMYDDLVVEVNGAPAQKKINPKLNASNCRALEGGYMNTKVKVEKDELTFIRNSSFYLTDAISCAPFLNETRFHNNLHLAKTFAKENDLNVQNDSKGDNKVGLMPYNYEFEKTMRVYSITFDLEMIGKDENFKNAEAKNIEKAERVNSILEAVQNLNLIVKGNLDNAEPIFIVGGLSKRKTHVFENVISVKNGNLAITDDLLYKISKGYKVGLLRGDNFKNENEIMGKLNPVSVDQFFDELESDINKYYGVEK
ncbi:type I-B CRISPR-associated protein Cas7/Cst2/DevR [uncultured Ilyobacter sp.]|uniref:type I-B CRISPR-associated protein Cas7/Cst2/DevR n=1 Tax=uncultured Ilyobacter sp. TaxID=544433 RepID=UPI0029F51FB1|nr:type I-B CRISPR-associated protein Cas7/Cst2/DevR [uncultured Ilyobacter sp.]